MDWNPGRWRTSAKILADIFHPFRDLYFVGLLGVLQRDQETGNTIQRFRRPHDPLVPEAVELPETPVFLIHPALDTFIRRQAHAHAISAIPAHTRRRQPRVATLFHHPHGDRKAVAQD